MLTFAYKKLERVFGIAIATLVVLGALAGYGAYAQTDTTLLSQVINPGTLTTVIRDAAGATVASPQVNFTAQNAAVACQSSPGTLGSATERIYVDNPDGADNGWTLAMAATSGATANWTDGGSNTFDFNDPSGTPAGCADGGGDADSIGGQLTVDPSGSTITADCTSCTNANISAGSSTAFNEGTTDSITIMSAVLASDDVGSWYQTGISLTQQIPNEQPAATYTIDMTLTATAL